MISIALNKMFDRPQLLVLLIFSLTGCASGPAPQRQSAAELEIRGKIADIRAAIMAKSATGIVAHGTPDWTFTGPDAVTFDRAGYLARTEALFARIVAIESLQTTVDRVAFPSTESADIEITQTMVRSERAPETGEITRIGLRYREQHRWIRAAGGWRIQRVSFIGTPERTVYPTRR